MTIKPMKMGKNLPPGGGIFRAPVSVPIKLREEITDFLETTIIACYHKTT